MRQLTHTALAALLAAPLTVGSIAAVAAPAPAPRDTVEAVAKAIDETFYDVAKARQIAAELRAEAARGGFDAYDDPRVLAVELTRRLKPRDGHFNVEWRDPSLAPPRAAGPAGAPRPQAVRVDRDRRIHYGFKRVEILPGNIGYIDMRMFADFDFADDKAPARRAVDAALALVADSDAVIIDLRQNGGGSPAMVGYLSSAFTPAGADIYNTFHYRRGDRTETESEAPAKFYATPDLDVPLYILTSGRTGSAAEALAYTLKNAKRAVIVGEATSGGANPGGTVEIPGGFRIFISGGSPRSPITGKNWEGTGVLPDVEVASADALATAQRLALEAASKRLTGPEKTEAEWALAFLTQAPAKGAALEGLAGEYSGLVVSVRDGAVHVVRGRRPAQVYAPLGGDLFRDVSEPTRRIRFNRDAAGKVVALEYVLPEGPGGLYRKGA